MPDPSPPPSAQPNPVAPAGAPGPSGLATLAVGVTVVAALYFGHEVLVPIVLAVLLSFILAPVVGLLQRWRLGRVVPVIAAVLVALGVILALGSVVGVQLAQLATDLPRYQATIGRKVDALRAGALGRASDLAKEVGRKVQDAAGQAPAGAPAPAAAPPAGTPENPLTVRLSEAPPAPVELARRVLEPVVHPLATLGIVLVVAVFLLLQREDLRNRMIRLFGAGDLHRTTVAMDDAARRLSRYFLAQVGINAAFGVLIGAGLWAIGVPSPILWAVVAALLRFVPYVGCAIAAALPVALAAAVDPTGWSTALWTLGLFLVAEGVTGQVVEPLVYGHSTGLSPFAVVVAALFWTWLWGPVGLLLSTPFTVCLVVLGRHVERLEFLDVLLGDRPALSPAEGFYQRMLAGDPDEALDQAELLLKDRPLSSYYDEVALKGLQLAARDAQRGLLPPDQVERVKTTVRSLIDDLADRGSADARPEPSDGGPGGPTLAEKAVPGREPLPDAPPRDRLPPAWRGEAPVLCLAGRGPLDEAASAMLAQLLQRHGLGARVLPHEAASRGGIERVDLAGVAMVCVSYLDIAGSPAHLRYLLQRLKRRLPGAPLLVGLWPAEEAVLTDRTLQSQLGADHYVTSLREAVEACLEEAGRPAEEQAPGVPRLPGLAAGSGAVPVGAPG